MVIHEQGKNENEKESLHHILFMDCLDTRSLNSLCVFIDTLPDYYLGTKICFKIPFYISGKQGLHGTELQRDGFSQISLQTKSVLCG